jgi:transglutaminase-like putative cysteine protease
MLAVSRHAGLPARYVSGHLLDEGGSHAWVEVLLEDTDRVTGWIAMALDPTHNRPIGLNYVTIATGRDYTDVAPTSGTYRASRLGSLHARNRFGLAAIDYRAPADFGAQIEA